MKQEKIVAFLNESSPHAKRVTTATAELWIGSEFVYKLKKALQLEYLDHRSLESRYQA